MRIVLGLNTADVEALRSLRLEQGMLYDNIIDTAEKEGRELSETEIEGLDEIMEKLDVLAKIEGVIDNQIEFDKEAEKGRLSKECNKRNVSKNTYKEKAAWQSA